jgi:hypothetical protein
MHRSSTKGNYKRSMTDSMEPAMAIARHLIVEGSRSNVSNGEPDHAVQRPGFP